MSPDFSDRNQKIVVSGVGIISPLGNGREKTWSALLNGESAIRMTSDGLQACVVDFSLNGARSRMGDFALLAAEESLRHAGLNPSDLTHHSIGCAISQSKPILTGSHLDSSLLLASFFGWSAEAVVKREFNLSGPSSNVVAACATGVAAIEVGASWIRAGLCDIALVGAAESSLTEFYRAGFEQMGVLAHGSPQCVKPFDKNRCGFAMGEGAAVLLLEKEYLAQARGHKALARLGRTVLQHSATDAVHFDSTGKAVDRLLKAVIEPGRTLDYINAHGTATVLNDVVETLGIKSALREKASSVKISSTKAATGHLLGAAGALEAAFCAMALRDQCIPPTLNLTAPDPVCDLEYVPDRSWSGPLQSAVSLSYGFGGQMGAVSFERI